MDSELFDIALTKANRIESIDNKIGLLGEKILHSTLKYYYDITGSFHEIKLNNYYADIFMDNIIYEIQTRSFDKLRNKLSLYLESNTVIVCHAVNHIKYQSWLDLKTLKLSNKRKCPKTGNIYQVFKELYKIKSFLSNKKLKFRFLLIDVHEIRNLDGYSENKKSGSSRYDRIPLKLVDEISINKKNDYQIFIPNELKEVTFDVYDYKKYTGLSLRDARTGLNILSSVDIIKYAGKDGKRPLYVLNKQIFE